ncbi:glycosyltransferase family 2 protein [Prevotella ihumii]|uniref:glycosyltransferase family 2 protein n=1 Tax=Prevotella ihumii TaxID=1917878 RepID=UPI000980F264|nr:glycosyltransferase family 2 protein [Prevotella ihumii]
MQDKQYCPKVTIVTVCYNVREAFLKTAHNVFAQDYANIEYVVVDGASTDGTVEAIQSVAQRIDHWVSEPDKGIYDAMNKAVGMASGEWVIFLNAGDTFATTDVLSRIFAEPHNAEVIYGDVVKGKTIKPAEPPHNAHRMYFCHQSCLTSRQALIDFPFDITHTMSADFKLFKQLWKAKKRFVQLSFPIANFDTNGVSNTNRSKGLLDNIKVIQETDNTMDKLRFLPRLYFVYGLCKLRNK